MATTAGVIRASRTGATAISIFRTVASHAASVVYSSTSSTREKREADFDFLQKVGLAFLAAYPAIVRRHMHSGWTDDQKQAQLVKRGRYVEFNLLYDRGTLFGLRTGGNPEAILMSLPPEVSWP